MAARPNGLPFIFRPLTGKGSCAKNQIWHITGNEIRFYSPLISGTTKN